MAYIWTELGPFECDIIRRDRDFYTIKILTESFNRKRRIIYSTFNEALEAYINFFMKSLLYTNQFKSCKEIINDLELPSLEETKEIILGRNKISEIKRLMKNEERKIKNRLGNKDEKVIQEIKLFQENIEKFNKEITLIKDKITKNRNKIKTIYKEYNKIVYNEDTQLFSIKTDKPRKYKEKTMKSSVYSTPLDLLGTMMSRVKSFDDVDYLVSFYVIVFLIKYQEEYPEFFI